MSGHGDYESDRTGEAETADLPLHVQATLAVLRHLNESIPTRPLYKYLAPEHAARMLSQGSVRIGSLAYYRAREAQDSLRGDASEGTADYIASPPGPQTAENLPPWARSLWTPPPGVNALRNRWHMRADHPDAYVYCLSHELSARAAGDYTACVEIVDVPGFFRELSNGLAFAHPRQPIEAEAQISAVTYAERVLPHEYHGYISPAFLKEHRFARECEVRGVWRTPKPDGAQHCDFSRPILRTYLRHVEIPPR